MICYWKLVSALNKLSRKASRADRVVNAAIWNSSLEHCSCNASLIITIITHVSQEGGPHYKAHRREASHRFVIRRRRRALSWHYRASRVTTRTKGNKGKITVIPPLLFLFNYSAWAAPWLPPWVNKWSSTDRVLNPSETSGKVFNSSIDLKVKTMYVNSPVCFHIQKYCTCT